jgi:hypothetical protein
MFITVYLLSSQMKLIRMYTTKITLDNGAYGYLYLILKIIPPKILARVSLMLITYNITTSNTKKDLLILS